MSINSRIKEIEEIFSVFDDSMDKYSQIIDFGKKHVSLQLEEKNEENRIYGCTSLAWVVTKKEGNFYSIKTDSDTVIVKGLLSILEFIINKSEKNEIIKLKIDVILKKIGLEESISSQRTNGFLSTLDKIKKQINAYD